MPPVFHRTTTSMGQRAIPDAPVPGKVDWDNFTTVERQRAALAWIEEVFRLILERNETCSLVPIIQYYTETFPAEVFPDRDGKLPVLDFVKLVRNHGERYGHNAAFRMLNALIADIGTVWLEGTMDGRGLVYRLRNMAPAWQVDKDELEALAAVLLT